MDKIKSVADQRYDHGSGAAQALERQILVKQ